jgi:cytochrome c-type biogenesis protein CcmH
MKALLTALFLTLSLSQALAVMPDEVLSNLELEMRARTISKELRCMVCQNQSIDDSDAQLAKDLRVIVRERLTAGDSNSEVFEFVEARYGEFVLLKPRVNAHTIALWVSPFLIVLAGLGLIWRRKTATTEPAALTAEEEQRIESLLKDY